MSDDIKNKEKMSNSERVDLSMAKRQALNKIKELSGDSEWNLIQQIAQEIEAHFIIKKEKLSLDKHLELVKQEVKFRYTDQPEVLTIMEEAIPSRITISHWKKKKGWEDSIWMKIRGEGLFTSDRRARVIEKLYDQASSDGNVQAAKIWLTLSGDYSEKDPAGKNYTLDLFREINQVIHGKAK